MKQLPIKKLAKIKMLFADNNIRATINTSGGKGYLYSANHDYVVKISIVQTRIWDFSDKPKFFVLLYPSANEMLSPARAENSVVVYREAIKIAKDVEKIIFGDVE